MHYESAGQKAFNTGSFDFTNGGVGTGYQFYAVKLSSGALALAAAATDPVIGFLLDVGVANQNVMVRLLSAQGTVNAVAGAAISANALLTVNASGQVVTATQSTAGTQPSVTVVGRALEAASGAGQIIEIEPMNIVY